MIEAYPVLSNDAQMANTQKDKWYQWLLQHRHGGDEDQLKAALSFLIPIRDKVLANAQFADEGIILDVELIRALIEIFDLDLHPGRGQSLIHETIINQDPESDIVISIAIVSR